MSDIVVTTLLIETGIAVQSATITHTSVFFGAAGTGLQPFIYTQNTPASVWTINHNLGYKPNCTLRDPAGNQYGADISHPNLTQTIVTHSAPTAGSARLI